MIDVQLVNRLHDQAMDAAGRAFEADLRGDFALTEKLFHEAFEAERQAAELVAVDKTAEPSRSILLRSAASLALDCRDFRAAERLVATGLAGDPPAELLEELRDLLEVIYFSRHLDIRGLELDPIEFQMSLVGDVVGFGIVESGQFLRRAETLERLLTRTAERKYGIPFRESGGPSKKTQRDFEVYFSTSRAASYAITVRLGRPQRQLLLKLSNMVQPSEVLDEVLDCIGKFESGDIDGLRARISEEAYYNNFTALAKKLSPDGDKIRTVGFTTIKHEQKQIAALTHPPLDVWKPQIGDAVRIEVTGKVRQADETSTRSKRPVLGVEDDAGKVTKISVPPGMLQDIVKPYWGEMVKVVATRNNRATNTLVDIQALDESAGK